MRTHGRHAISCFELGSVARKRGDSTAGGAPGFRFRTTAGCEHIIQAEPAAAFVMVSRLGVTRLVGLGRRSGLVSSRQ